jgi:tetratricopeptide (TPR) repeat protein
MKRLEEAMQCYEAALRLDPEDHEAAAKRAWLLISFGNYREGWRDTEHRLALLMPQLRRHQHLPRWTGGESLVGKRVVIWSEQGHGDVIQYCRFALDLLALGAEVVLEVKPPLVELCASMPGCQVIALDAPLPPCDFQIAVASLPHALGIDSDAVPHAAGYLRAPAQAVQRWSSALPPRRHALRIGIACSGFGGHSRNLMRSMPLRHFLPLAECADLFLLQPPLGHEDEHFQQRHPEIGRPRIEANSFADTAGLVENMDLVISVDTSIAHLAASLGKETWMLLDWVSEWRWMHDIGYSPWYRSLRLFRQKARADWSSVIREVLQALSERQRA